MDPLFVAIIVYLLAILFFVIDIFLPTGGVLLLCSAISAIIAIYFGFRAGTTTGLLMSMTVLGSIPAMFYAFLKIWPHTPLGRRVLLEPQSNPALAKDQLRDLIGTVVTNRWPLIPTGQIQIGHRRYNAMSFDGKTIEVKERVKVIDVHERMLVVCQTSEPLSDPNSVSAKLIEPAAATPAGDPLNMPAKQLGLDSLDELPLDEA
jgi:membrane-bound ClpP family serine protease